jgi:hypothetical protein
MTVERGVRTRGRVARAMTGADSIEIKATIPDCVFQPIVDGVSG